MAQLVNAEPTFKYVQSFSDYVELHAKDAECLERIIVEKLEDDNLPLAACRSQYNDNATVVTRHISGF